jgi:two-component system sensor histidine kinase KdpD
MVRSIVTSADRLNTFIANLLDISRLEVGAWPPLRELYPFVEIVTGALGRLPEAQAERVQFDIDDHLPLISVDPLQIEQVVWNLLENAVKYSPPGTPAGLSARVDNGRLRVSVRDYGPGIPPGRETDIFRKFYRVQSEGGPPGLGLGLAICKAAVEAHRGSIYAENADPGPGAIFTFLLPEELLSHDSAVLAKASP